jgi:hypothetical protein
MVESCFLLDRTMRAMQKQNLIEMRRRKATFYATHGHLELVTA